jgi:hypothetical protein
VSEWLDEQRGARNGEAAGEFGDDGVGENARPAKQSTQREFEEYLPLSLSEVGTSCGRSLAFAPWTAVASLKIEGMPLTLPCCS